MGTYIMLGGTMISLIKWIAVFLVAPILLLKEVWNVIQAMGIDLGNPDDLLNQAKAEVKDTPKKKKKKSKKKDETIIIVE